MKAMKKVFAMLLALAMIVTAVPVSSASAATYNMKAGSAGIITKTLYAGRSHTLKLNGYKASQIKSTTWSVGKTTVVKLASKTKTTAKMTCVGKGYTVVTAKMTLTNKKVKTFKAKITVKNPSLKVTPAELNLKVGERAVVDIDYKPTNAKVTYSIRNEAVATNAGNKITATGEGTTILDVKLVCGTKTISKQVKVVVDEAGEGDAAGEYVLKTTVANHIEGDFQNADKTVFVTENATLQVKVLDKTGAPVANKQIVMLPTSTTVTKHKILSSTTTLTDANGIATYVIGIDTSAAGATLATDIFDSTKSEPFSYTVTVADSTQQTMSDAVFFAYVDLNEVQRVIDPPAGFSAVPGTSFKDANASSNGTIDTYSVNSNALDVDYVASQQTSAADGGKSNKVKFKVTGGLKCGAATIGTGATTTVVYDQKIEDGASGEYGTHENKYKIIELDKPMDEVDYATLFLTNVQISKYTALYISTYKTESDAKKGIYDSSKPYETLYTKPGEHEQTTISYQIPKQTGIKFIRIDIYSRGQVNMDKNDGFVADKITYRYQKKDAAPTVNLSDAVSVKWSIESNLLYDIEKSMDAATATALGIPATTSTGEAKTGWTYIYQVPSFPQTGNAIIREYDANKILMQYYAIPTINGRKWRDAATGAFIITDSNTAPTGTYASYSTDDGRANYNVINTAYQAWQITEPEATKAVGKIVEDETKDNYVVVESMDQGTTMLVGEVTVNGVVTGNGANKVYTSVMWSALPKDVPQDERNTGFVAIKGQNVVVEAQITDRNGAPVALGGKSVQFYYLDNGKDTETGINQVHEALKSVNKYVTVTALSSVTDPNGRASVTLRAGNNDVLLSLTAKLSDESDQNKYDVRLVIKSEVCKTADIYWTDAKLTFTPNENPYDTGAAKKYNSSNIGTMTADEKPMPKTNETWQYEVETTCTNLLSYGVLAGKSVTIKGLTTKYTILGLNTGVTQTPAKNGAATLLKSTKSGLVYLKAELDTTALNENASVEGAGIYAGSGSVNIFDSLTIPVQWQAVGVKAEWVNPYGPFATGDRDLYLKVVDINGNPIANKQVTFSPLTDTSSNEVIDATQTGATATTGGAIVITNGEGIAKITVKKQTNNTSTVITASVEGVTEPYSTVVNWRAPSADKLSLVQAVYNAGNASNPDTIVLTFNKEIADKSVVAKQFTVSSPGVTSGSSIQYTVAAANVIGNKIILSMSSSDIVKGVATDLTVTIGDATLDSIKYAITCADGTGLDTNYNSLTFASNANVNLSIGTVSTSSIAVTADATASGNVYAVDVDGKVYAGTVSGGAGTITISGAGYYLIYFGNVVKDVTIS